MSKNVGFRFQRFHLPVVIACFTLLTDAAGVRAQLPPDKAADPLELLRKVPQSPEELEPRQDLADSRAKALAARIQQFATPESDESRQLQSVSDAWVKYREASGELRQVWGDLSEASANERAATLAKETTHADQEARRLKRTALPLSVSEERLAEWNQQLQSLEARIGVLSERQADRAALMAGGLAERRARLQSELEKLRQQYEDARRQTSTRASAADGAVFDDVTREQVEVTIATTELQLKLVGLRRQLTERNYRGDEGLLNSLRQWQDALSRFVHALTEARGRSAIEQLEHVRAVSDQPLERARAGLRLFVERVSMKYFRPQQSPGIQGPTTPPLQLDRVDEQVRRSQARWERVARALELQGGQSLSELRVTLREDLKKWRSRRTALRLQHQKFLAALQDLESIRQLALERFEQIAEDTLATIAQAGLSPDEKSELDAEVSAQRHRLTEQAQRAFERVNPLAQSIAGTLQTLALHIENLEAIDQRIQWVRMLARDSGLMKTDWIKAGKLATATAAGLFSSAPVVVTPDDAEFQVLTPTESAILRARERRVELSALPATLSIPEVSVAAGLMMAALVGGFFLRRVSRRRGEQLAVQIAEDYRRAKSDADTGALYGLSARVDLLLWNMLGDLAMIILPSGVVSGVVLGFAEGAESRQLILALVALIAGTMTAARLVHHLLEPFSAPHRPLPCSDFVAQHYRRWLTLLLLYSSVILLTPILLRVANLAPALQSACLEVFKTGALIIVLLFLLPRRRVLGRIHGQRAGWIRIALYSLYPMFVLLVVGLLCLQVIGYGAIVSYVSFGVVFSILLLMLSVVVAEYLVDLAEHRRIKGLQIDGEFTSVSSKTPGRDGAAPDQTRYSLSFLCTLIRIVISILALLGIAWAWGIPFSRSAVNVRLVGLCLLTVVVAIVVDRVVLAATRTLERSKRLPANTVRMIRRWLRGAILLLGLVAMVGIAGWRIDSLVTFLTTLLAMVAIGFVAVWSILSNLLATLVILIWRPFNLGEEIELAPDGLSGRVVDINFMYTILRNEDDSQTSIPNSLFAQKFIKRKLIRHPPKRSLAEQLESTQALET